MSNLGNPHLDSTSTVGILGSSDGSRSRSRSRSRSPPPSLEPAVHSSLAQLLMELRQIFADHERALRQIEVDRVTEDTSAWPILVGPGLLNSQQNRLEMVSEHQFTGTVLSGLFNPQNMIERVTAHQQHRFPETAHRLQ